MINGSKVSVGYKRLTSVWRALANGEAEIKAVRGVSKTLQTAEVIIVHRFQDSCYTLMMQMTNIRFQ